MAGRLVTSVLTVLLTLVMAVMDARMFVCVILVLHPPLLKVHVLAAQQEATAMDASRVKGCGGHGHGRWQRNIVMKEVARA